MKNKSHAGNKKARGRGDSEHVAEDNVGSVAKALPEVCA